MLCYKRMCWSNYIINIYTVLYCYFPMTAHPNMFNIFNLIQMTNCLLLEAGRKIDLAQAVTPQRSVSFKCTTLSCRFRRFACHMNFIVCFKRWWFKKNLLIHKTKPFPAIFLPWKPQEPRPHYKIPDTPNAHCGHLLYLCKPCFNNGTVHVSLTDILKK